MAPHGVERPIGVSAADSFENGVVLVKDLLDVLGVFVKMKEIFADTHEKKVEDVFYFSFSASA